MSTVLVLATARARGITLPADDDVAQGVLDEVEGWLVIYLGGPLTGPRTETFFTGYSTSGKLSLSRYTDAVTVEDNGVAVAADRIRLIDRGSAVARDYSAPSWWWTGPYVEVTYTPNDQDALSSVAYQLLALSASPTQAAAALKSEQIGSYSYNLGNAAATPQSNSASRRALARTLVPVRDKLGNVDTYIHAMRGDYPERSRGIVNAAELPT